VQRDQFFTIVDQRVGVVRVITNRRSSQMEWVDWIRKFYQMLYTPYRKKQSGGSRVSFDSSQKIESIS
jgi:hypothetical protein